LPIRQPIRADDAVGGQHTRGRVFIARGFRALDIVHGFNEIVDAERDRRHQDDAEGIRSRRTPGRPAGIGTEKPKLAKRIA